MARYPGAHYRPIPEATTQPQITPRAVVVHSQAGRGSLYGFWNSPGTVLESTFWIAEDGRVEQYVPTDVRADAQGDANAFAISIETESSPEATERWNPRQAAALINLISWCCTTHDIPRRLMKSPIDAGLAWHVQFGAPGPWTKVVGKTCPGPARIEQFKTEIVPAVADRGATQAQPQKKDWFTMATKEDLRDVVREELDRSPRLRTLSARTASTWSWLRVGIEILGGLAGKSATWMRARAAAYGRLDPFGD